MACLPAHRGGPDVVGPSLRVWLVGHHNPERAAKCRAADGQWRRFVELYPSAPAPRVRRYGQSAEESLDALLRNGAPLLVFGEPFGHPLQGYFGNAAGRQAYRVPLTLYAAVWQDAERGLRDAGASVAQLHAGCDHVTRLLAHHGGTFRLYDFTLPPEKRYASPLGTARVSVAQPPFERVDQWRVDWVLTVELHRERG